jgi:hypothetical protein
MNLYLNRLDPTRDEKLISFLEHPTFQKKAHFSIDTDAEYDDLFEKIAKVHQPDKWSKLEETVKELFPENEKMASQLGRFGQRLSLDRTRLKELFTYDKE